MSGWRDADRLSANSYVCGYCDHDVSSDRGYVCDDDRSGQAAAALYLCHRCDKPTYFGSGEQVPPPSGGAMMEGVDDSEVSGMYAEARKCLQAGAYTAAAMSCRKILMSVAVHKGASEGQSYQQYVDWLVKNGYVPPDGKEWVDEIRKAGNDANHEIVLVEKGTAAEILDFVTMLLVFVYEMPFRMRQRKVPTRSNK